jgi:hypothetical protein
VNPLPVFEPSNVQGESRHVDSNPCGHLALLGKDVWQRGSSQKRIVLDSALKPMSSPEFSAGKEWGAFVSHELGGSKAAFRLPPPFLSPFTIRPEAA